jgi:hypothetical protein
MTIQKAIRVEIWYGGDVHHPRLGTETVYRAFYEA